MLLCKYSIVIYMDERTKIYLQERLRKKSKRGDTGCVEWIGAKNLDGYGLIRVTESGKKTITMYCHRALWVALHGSIDRKIFVRHKCNNRSCINPDHLFVASPTECDITQ